MSSKFSGINQWNETTTLVEDDVDTRKAQTNNDGMCDLADSTSRLRNAAYETALLNWTKSPSAPGDFMGGTYAADYDTWIIAGGASVNTFVAFSRDGGATWTQAGTFTIQGISDVVAGGDVVVVVGQSGTVQRRDLNLIHEVGAWTIGTAPGAPTNIRSVAWDPLILAGQSVSSLFVAVGEKRGNAAYIAISVDGQDWTEFSAPDGLPSGGLGSLAAGGGRAVACTTAAHTKLVYTADGVTWSESTTTVQSGIYQVTWNATRELFYALRTNSYTANYLYSSKDGDIWKLVYSGGIQLGTDFAFDSARSVGGSTYHGFVSIGPMIAAIGPHRATADTVSVAMSTDGGQTWRSGPIAPSSPMTLVSDGRARALAANLTGYVFRSAVADPIVD